MRKTKRRSEAPHGIGWWNEERKVMRLLLTLDEHNYTPDLAVYEKYSTRAVIMRNGRIATQHGAAGDYKILGGGVEPGEDLHAALIREVQEESGLVVILSLIHI